MVIRENEKKWVFLGLFTVGLFLLGVVAGRLFTSLQLVSKRNVSVSILLSILCSFSSDRPALAQQEKSEKYEARLEISPPRVGKLSHIRWSLVGIKEGERAAVNLSLRIIHLEKGKTVFAIEKLPVPGEFTLNFQFTDGAEYRIEYDGRASRL